MPGCTVIPDIPGPTTEPQHSKPSQSRPDRAEANHRTTTLFFAQFEHDKPMRSFLS